MYNRRKSGKLTPTVFVLLELVGLILVLYILSYFVPEIILELIAIIGFGAFALFPLREYSEKLTRRRD